MTHRPSLPYARSSQQRPSCNVEQARTMLCSDSPPSRQHIYNLFNRGDVEGFFLGSGRGLRIYIDSIETLIRRQNGDELLADYSGGKS
jgi:hypothetical protein